MAVKDRAILTRVWEGFLTSIGISDSEDKFKLVPGEMDLKEFEQRVQSVVSKTRATPLKISEKRSMSFSRLREQLWNELYKMEDDWAYPIDIYVDDNGKDIFAIVAQSGKLFSVPLEVSEESVTMGTWVQVKEEFSPVTQTRTKFSVQRQKDGKYRWLCIAGTTILNRVGEIDSSTLFDSFIERAKRTEKYPRLDFYHLGETNPKMWEFGTADYLARDGVCYIASGLFDEDHPLARATIKACEEEPDIWGNSIEFYAYSEPEIVIADPEVRIPVYKDGENIRISVVLEADAAGLFTRIGVNQEVKRTMDANTKEVLGKLFGDDTEGMKAFIDSFEGNVDGVNRTVQNKNLIHRAKKTETAPVEEDPEKDEEDDKDEDDEREDSEFEVTDELVGVIAAQVTQTAEFKSLVSGMEEIKQMFATQATENATQRTKDAKEIARLNKVVTQLSKDEGDKKSEYLQDLPREKRTKVGYRPRDKETEDSEAEKLETSDEKAARTMGKFKQTY